MKTCVVMQPTYLPWLGYFDLIDQADVFVFYNDVQYVKGQWGSRNRINTSNGETFLTIPIKKHPLSYTYENIELDNGKPWVKKHLKTLFFTYQKSEYFKEVYAFMEDLLKMDYDYLGDLNIKIIVAIAGKLNIKTEFRYSSDLESKEGVKDIRLVNICNELNCKNYLSPFGASLYIEENNSGGEFALNNIGLGYQNFAHPEYAQTFGEFKSHMSIVDLLFNEGLDNSLEIIRKGRRKSIKSEEIQNYA